MVYMGDKGKGLAEETVVSLESSDDEEAEKASNVKRKSGRPKGGSLGRKRAKRRKRADECMLVDDMADVAGSDEEEEEEFINDKEENVGGSTARKSRRILSFMVQDDSDDVDAIEKFCKERYGRGKHKFVEESEDDEGLVSEDAKFWKIKCKQGHESEAVLSLMEKNVELKASGQSPLTKSVIAPSNSKGFIFVESENEAHVKQACKGLQLLHPLKLTPISNKDIAKILDATKEVGYKAGDWVQVKSGLYKGDVAEVLEVTAMKQQARVKLVPRIDLHEVQLRLERSQRKGKNDKSIKEALISKKRSRVKPQKLITLKEAVDMKIPVKCRIDRQGRQMYSFADKSFLDGYLVKLVPLKSIKMISKPTVKGLQNFQSPGSCATHPLVQQKQVRFAKGDKIVVVEGEFSNKAGCVELVDQDTVHVRLNANSQVIVKVHQKQLREYFEVGAHVRVASGTHEGATGLVLSVEDDHILILSDISKEELRVPKDCLAGSFDVAPVITKLGDYQLHDLVSLDHATFGMILRAEKDAFIILKGVAEKVELMTVKPRDILKKIFDKTAIAQDCGRNMIRLKATVQVQSGPFKGKQGLVQHIHGGLLFIYDNRHLNNGGFICVRAISCLILGGERKAGTSAAGFKGAPRDGNPEQGARGPKMQHGLMGKQVRIRRGIFKGHRGRVQRVHNGNVHVFLEARLKIVTVKLDDVIPIETVPSTACTSAPSWDAGPAAADGVSKEQDATGNGWDATGSGCGWGTPSKPDEDELTKEKDKGWDATANAGWGTPSKPDENEQDRGWEPDANEPTKALDEGWNTGVVSEGGDIAEGKDAEARSEFVAVGSALWDENTRKDSEAVEEMAVLDAEARSEFVAMDSALWDENTRKDSEAVEEMAMLDAETDEQTKQSSEMASGHEMEIENNQTNQSSEGGSQEVETEQTNQSSEMASKEEGGGQEIENKDGMELDVSTQGIPNGNETDNTAGVDTDLGGSDGTTTNTVAPGEHQEIENADGMEIDVSTQGIRNGNETDSAVETAGVDTDLGGSDGTTNTVSGGQQPGEHSSLAS